MKKSDSIATPFSPMRKVVAYRMTEATQSIPHFRMVKEIVIDDLLALRKEINQGLREGKVSLNDLLVKATAAALMENPKLNIQVIDSEIHQFAHADIVVVIAVENGLMTPVIRRADMKSVVDIAIETRDFAARAAKGKLKMSEIEGGSFSMSNIGNYSIDQFDAIINPPQAAILAIAGATKKPVVKRGEVSIATVLKVCLSLDHRALDGRDGATFLDSLAEAIRNPERLLAEQMA